jgi:type III restriction enzyme
MAEAEGEQVSEAVAGAAAALDPILNPPYDEPTRYFVLGPQGPTGEIKEGRRPSEAFIPIAASRKGLKTDEGVQETLDVALTSERRERNPLINDLRREVERWRHRDYERVTPISRKLLQHWADDKRENRVLFCQREAAETAIFLAEVAGRHGYADFRGRIDEANAEHNAGLPRVALKMATGSGKTVVMAMLIAWQTLNKAANPRDARFAKRFLIATPGITIRDRLRVLVPAEKLNYYDERDLIPADLYGGIRQAQIVVTNFHAFQAKDAKEIRGVAATTRKILTAERGDDPFRESPEAMVARVLRDIGGGTEPVVVFNDEAHHCYLGRADTETTGPRSETREDAEAARVWFRGVQAVTRKAGVKTIYDLSATPFYLGGSGYHEGFIFPWTVSDFSLMDAIESGIVKIPRTPVDDDATGELVTYLRLWDYVGPQLPKKRGGKVETDPHWVPPKELEGALTSLYRSYLRSFDHWRSDPAWSTGPPPVFIVVCPNTVVSKRVYDWIAGTSTDTDSGTTHRPGNLAEFSNVVDGRPLSRPRTILVDSAQLESGETMKPDFKAVAAAEIEAFKVELRARGRSSDADNLTDEDLLREVMNTVGKPGKLGEGVRCVVSVAMLTEGWDANTVTHILGIRAFGSQLLCEQVVGRGLRRRSYAVNPDSKCFDAEYANVYGVPFAFIPTDRPTPEPIPLPPPEYVETVPGREHLRITFPKLDGYRVEIPDDVIDASFDDVPRFEVGPSTVPTRTDIEGIVGGREVETDETAHARRSQQIAYELAKHLLRAPGLTALDGDLVVTRFPKLTAICRSWLDACVDVADGYAVGHILASAELRQEAVEAIFNTIAIHVGNRRARLRPILRDGDPSGDTSHISFATRKPVERTEKSEVSHVTLDGRGGNTWEQILALECELSDDVAAYVKNDRLGFTIPYVHQGRAHSYYPDFLIRLRERAGDPFTRTLIVEVSGSQKSPGPTAAKAETARNQWCVAVNNHGGFGRWGYVEITSMVGVRDRLRESIRLLYDDAPIIGDPDLLDFAERWRDRAAS